MQHLLDHLNQKYEQYLKELEGTEEAAVNFISFSKLYLNSINRPVNISYAAGGLGLIMSDNTHVSLCDVKLHTSLDDGKAISLSVRGRDDGLEELNAIPIK